MDWAESNYGLLLLRSLAFRAAHVSPGSISIGSAVSPISISRIDFSFSCLASIRAKYSSKLLAGPGIVLQAKLSLIDGNRMQIK